MKRFIFAAFAAGLLVSCAQKEDFLTETISDGLIDVTFTAGIDDESKVMTGWNNSVNSMFWSKGDAIGLFAGSDNVNRKFFLTSQDGQKSGTFSGQMMPVSTPTTLYVYYPYDENAAITKVPYPDQRWQVFEGTFDEKGSFSNFGEYSLLFGRTTNFTISTKWPSGTNINFNSLAGLVRFALSSTLPAPINVKSVGMVSSQNSFIRLTTFNLTNSNYSGYYSNLLSTTISDKNPLVLDKSATKYVQLACSASTFKENETIEVYVEAISDDGQNIRFVVPKTVGSAYNLAIGKRTSVSVPITSSTSVSYASRVKLTTASGCTSLMAPIIRHDSNYEAADAVWGDSTVETFESGRIHTFKTSGTHSSSFNFWGTTGSVKIEKLNGITAIDFSEVYQN